MGKIWNKIKKISKNTALIVSVAASIHYGPSQIVYFSRYLGDEINPPADRVEFERETGIKVTGYKSDETKHALFYILEQAKTIGLSSNDIDKIVFESPNYFEKPIIGQLSETIFAGYSGYFNPITKNIIINSTDNRIFAHEAFHAKSFTAKNFDKLIEEWSSNAKDSNGSSYYLSKGEWLCSRIRLLSKTVDYKTNYDSLGFISSYATTNVYEDIAELCEGIINNTEYIIQRAPMNDKLRNKIDLAMKYELIPKETTEFLQTMDPAKKYLVSDDIWSGSYDGYVHSKDSLKKDFLQKSTEFLEKYPESPYVSNIYCTRGQVKTASTGRVGIQYSKESEEDFKRALRPCDAGYIYALLHLETLHQQIYGQFGDKNPYTEANKIYTERRNNFDLRLFTRGVNDVLEAKGELPIVQK